MCSHNVFTICMRAPQTHKHANICEHMYNTHTHTQRTMSVVENDCHVKRPHGDKKSHGRLDSTTHQSLHHKSQLTESDSSGAARKWAAFLPSVFPFPFLFLSFVPSSPYLLFFRQDLTKLSRVALTFLLLQLQPFKNSPE